MNKLPRDTCGGSRFPVRIILCFGFLRNHKMLRVIGLELEKKTKKQQHRNEKKKCLLIMHASIVMHLI